VDRNDRPFPMVGNFYANFFVHFEVLGPLEGESNFDPELGIPPYLIHGSKWAVDWKQNNPKGWNMVRALVKEFAYRNMWLVEEFSFGCTSSIHTQVIPAGIVLFACLLQLKPGRGPILARKGNLKNLQAMSKYNPLALTQADQLGWTAFHEGIRSGKLEIVKFLLDRGADINLLTDAGMSPLWIAREYLGADHEVSKYLEDLGAILSLPRETQQQEGEKVAEVVEDEEDDDDDEEDDDDDEEDDDDDEHDEL
jgi:hypothetical protein